MCPRSCHPSCQPQARSNDKEPQRQGLQGPQWNTFPRRLRAQALLPPGASPGDPTTHPSLKNMTLWAPWGKRG